VGQGGKSGLSASFWLYVLLKLFKDKKKIKKLFIHFLFLKSEDKRFIEQNLFADFEYNRNETKIVEVAIFRPGKQGLKAGRGI